MELLQLIPKENMGKLYSVRAIHGIKQIEFFDKFTATFQAPSLMLRLNLFLFYMFSQVTFQNVNRKNNFK